jgi:enolase-phosphatase E1
MRRPRGVLIDIEGTTTRIAYVRDVLFPFARARLPALLAQAADRREVATELAEVARLAPGQAPLDALLAWMDEDAKVTPLKTLQGIIWHGGYQSGELQGELYPDVAPALRRWHAAGIRLDMYSSGSAAAQRLLFGHSAFGDLTPVLSGFHDTAVGPKQRAASYAAITGQSGIAPADWLFLSDMAPELDAATAAGLQTCQLLRPADFTLACPNHATAVDFDAVEQLWVGD